MNLKVERKGDLVEIREMYGACCIHIPVSEASFLITEIGRAAGLAVSTEIKVMKPNEGDFDGDCG